MKLFKIKFSKKVTSKNFNLEESLIETAKTLKFFRADFIEIENNKVFFYNQLFHWSQNLMTPINDGFVEFRSLKSDRIKLIYQFRFDKVIYGFLIVLLVGLLITKSMNFMISTLVFFGISMVILFITQFFIYRELANNID